MASCRTCGLSISETAPFCPTCGATVVQGPGFAGAEVGDRGPDVVMVSDGSLAGQTFADTSDAGWGPGHQAPELLPLSEESRVKRWATTGGRPLGIIVCLVVLLSIGLGFAQGLIITQTIHSGAWSDSVTLDEYQRLATGQTVAEADAILFGDNYLDKSNADRTFEFTNRDGSTVSLTFVNGTLQEFSESGLRPGDSSSEASRKATGVLLYVFLLLIGLVSAAAGFVCLWAVVRWRGFNLTIKQMVVVVVVVAITSAVTGMFLPSLLVALITFIVYAAFLIAWTDGDSVEALIIGIVTAIASWVIISMPMAVGVWLGFALGF